MNTIVREKIIPPEPERIVTETIYVASDGKEFRFKSDCEAHEKRIEIESHPVFKSRVKARTFYEDNMAWLYYFRSGEDYEFWLDNIGTRYLNRDHWKDGFGPGWYLFYSEDGGDYADSHYLYKLEEYEKDCRQLIDEWSAATWGGIKDRLVNDEGTTL